MALRKYTTVGRKRQKWKSSCSLRVSAEVPQTRENKESSYGIRRATNPIATRWTKTNKHMRRSGTPKGGFRNSLYWGSSFKSSHKTAGGKEQGNGDREGGKPIRAQYCDRWLGHLGLSLPRLSGEHRKPSGMALTAARLGHLLWPALG